MSSIPRELWLNIVSKIDPRDKATLLACHAVSRDLRVVARITLFSNIILALPPDDPTKELQEFYEFVSTRPYVATSIRYLRISGTTGTRLEDAEVEDTDGDYYERADTARGPYNCNVDITPLYRSLSLLKKLEKLRLYHVLPPLSVNRTPVEQIHCPEVSIAIPCFDSEEEGDRDDAGNDEEDIRAIKLLFNILSMFDSIGKLSVMTRPFVIEAARYLGVDNAPPVSIPSQLKVDCLWLENGNDTFWDYLMKLQFARELRGVEIGWNISEENVRRLHNIVQLSSATLEYLKLRAFHQYDYFNLSTCRNLKTLAIHMYFDKNGRSISEFTSFISLKGKDSFQALQTVIFEIHSYRDTTKEVLKVAGLKQLLASLHVVLLEVLDRTLRKVEWRCDTELCATLEPLLPKLLPRGILAVIPDDTLRYEPSYGVPTRPASWDGSDTDLEGDSDAEDDNDLEADDP